MNLNIGTLTIQRFGPRMPDNGSSTDVGNNHHRFGRALGFIFCLSITSLLVLGSSAAWACSCKSPPSIAERFQASTDVFIATAMSVHYFTEGESDRVNGRQKAKIRVGEVFKGSGKGYDVIRTRVNFRPPGATPSDWISTSCDHTGLHAGKSYIVFGTDGEPPSYGECRFKVVPIDNQDLNELRGLRDSDT